MTQHRIHHSEHSGREQPPGPDFLTLPPRTRKPRATGLSHILDNGLALADVEDRLAAASDAIDLWKFGWGTAYVDPAVRDKVALLARHDVLACTGGTLLEIAWRQRAVGPFLDWAEATGFPAVEVSNGSGSMTPDAKRELIQQTAARFVVLAEVGRKDPAVVLTPDDWGRDARADLEAGARWVVTEGRESGTVGLFTAEGSVRTDVLDAVVAGIGLDRALFEAPRRAQQAWLIRRYGPNVNLGNIAAAEALAVETLRLGLRVDTMDAPFTHDARVPAAEASP